MRGTRSFRTTLRICIAAGAGMMSTGCRKEDKPPAKPAGPVAQQADSASGDVTQYSLMKPMVGWLTDSNIVALATLVNQAPLNLARAESQAWSNEQIHAL